MAKLTFIGGTGQVTGSCYLLETSSGRILLECGLYQGGREADKQNEEDFPFIASDIDAVVLSHAHLDHSGRLPRLVQQGFRGKVFVTEGSFHLLDLLLKDAASLQQRDVEWENKRRQRKGKKPKEVLYTQDDVNQLLDLRQAYDYAVEFEVLPGLTAKFTEAGHILGSAVVSLCVEQEGGSKTLVFSGDLGNPNSPLLRDPRNVTKADVLMLESTYGDRDHKPLQPTLDEFKRVLQLAKETGGNVIIPSFAVARTQDLLYWLGKFYRNGELPQQQVYLDSPMAIGASTIYENHVHLFNKDDPEFTKEAHKGWQGWLPNLNYAQTPEDSMAVNKIEGGAIIIAGSGMCTGGRIRHHLKYNLWRRNAHIIFVGYQAQGTLGRQLVDGRKDLKILGSPIRVAANIHTLGGLSAHADQSQLLDWAMHFDDPKPQLFLVHGEPLASMSLKTCFHRAGWEATIPTVGQQVSF
jgi:metallo-beta-lactamase family protein